MTDRREINGSAAKKIFEAMYDRDADPQTFAEEMGMKTVNDDDALRTAAERALAENPKSVEDYLGGKEKAFGFLMGQTMRAMKGKGRSGGGQPDPEGAAGAKRLKRLPQRFSRKRSRPPEPEKPAPAAGWPLSVSVLLKDILEKLFRIVSVFAVDEDAEVHLILPRIGSGFLQKSAAGISMPTGTSSEVPSSGMSA